MNVKEFFRGLVSARELELRINRVPSRTGRK